MRRPRMDRGWHAGDAFCPDPGGRGRARRQRPKGFLSSQWTAGIAPRLRTGRLTTGGIAIPDQGSCGLPAPPPKGGIAITRLSG